MYRLVDTEMWDDAWYSGLKHYEAKYLFVWFLTNRRTNSVGAYEITLRQVAFETGMSMEIVERSMNELHPKIQWWPEHSIVWVRNFYGRQNNGEKIEINAKRIVADLPPEIREAVGMAYPALSYKEDTPYKPHTSPMHKQNSNVTVLNTTATSSALAREDPGAPALPSVTVKPVLNGHCAFADAVGAEKFAKYAGRFADVNVQLGPSWLSKTICRYEAEGLGLPPPAMVRALEIACARIGDGLGREGNAIGNPPAWAAKQIGEAIRDEAARATA